MKVVSTPNAPAAIGPYSQALDLGNMVFVSGQIPVDPATGKMADTVEEQAAQSLAKNQVEDMEGIKGFSQLGYHFSQKFSGRHQRLCGCERRVCQGLCRAVPGSQLRAGGSHPQGCKARDRVHRGAGLIPKATDRQKRLCPPAQPLLSIEKKEEKRKVTGADPCRPPA